jgi:acyl-CoA dehydrogenase
MQRCAWRPCQPAGPRRSRSSSGNNDLADEGRRGDSAAEDFSSQECEERPMDFNMSDRQREWLNRVQSFIHQHVRPAVPVYNQQDAEGERWKVIPVLED